ncbi:MAG TPA: hypothetical protein VFI06_03350, partial [Chitinophagaceae bacterium]|nr:hypothetical protein [Chitinophagaceae bacterium]
MKKYLIIALGFMVATTAKAQMPTPVSWSYTAKKTSDKTYEVRLTATIQSGWHLYSQKQPADAIVEPTKITFNKNPLLKLDGNIREEGKM